MDFLEPRVASPHHCADHWLRTIRTGRRTNSSSLDKRDAGKFGTIDYQSFYRDIHDTELALNGRKKVEPLVGVWERKGEGPRGVSTPAEELAFDVSWWTFPVCPTGTSDWDKVAVGIYNDGPRASWILSSAPETRSLLWFIMTCIFFFNGSWDFSTRLRWIIFYSFDGGESMKLQRLKRFDLFLSRKKEKKIL